MSSQTPDVQQPVLRGVDLTKKYQVGRSVADRLAKREGRALTALDGVSIEVFPGEVLAVVGESGSGKSTLAKLLVGSETASSGEVVFEGKALSPHRDSVEARRIQMVFQDPYSSLNPRLTIGSVLTELIRYHRIVPRDQVKAEASRLLKLVGLDDDALEAYPSQFSGGQRQRVAIARALAVRPDVLIADEPVSALDVSVQATILELIADLRDQLGLSVLFIAHNLAVVQHLSQRVAVMYLGRIVEIGTAAELFANPSHPYTRALIASIPRMKAGSFNSEFQVKGEPPSPYSVPQGCRFHPRCPLATDECRSVDPALIPVSAGDTESMHLSACLRIDALPPMPEAFQPPAERSSL
ncbi:MAG: ABC transporter ATP-binding protein [Microbacterium sp. 69-10]|uniref:ABC transporter ATP-binding protein n=1 Tax=Microbacterium sp. 69-10 TaxID=1895783 RepID=UPI000964C406|nr:ABC transporter ATP-binding protein [Microbacterium sp. 69-10]OJU41287.1 MAG: ABC transporter ATP-binding protein [Microbacterium sp. 69-10]